MALERVQKLLAQAGIASRRKAEELILEGAVTVNGKVVQLGDKAEFGKDAIKVNGKLIQTKEPPVYIAFHKPKGVISTMSDPENRPSLASYLGKIKTRVFPIGRLDFNSEGLILLTNDGAFAERVQKSTNLLRVYEVKVKGRPDAAQIARLQKGAKIGNRLVHPHSVRLADELPSKVVLEVSFNDPGVIDVKQLFEMKGFLVDKISRTAIGHLTLRGIAPGQFRALTESQVTALLNQPELGMRRLELHDDAARRNAEGGYAYRRPSRSMQLKTKRRLTAQAETTGESDEGAKIIPSSDAETPTRASKRPSGIMVRQKRSGSEGKRPRFGGGDFGGQRSGGFEKRPRFGARSERDRSDERGGSFEKRPRFGARSEGDEGRGAEGRGGFKKGGFGKPRGGFGSYGVQSDRAPRGDRGEMRSSSRPEGRGEVRPAGKSFGRKPMGGSAFGKPRRGPKPPRR